MVLKRDSRAEGHVGLILAMLLLCLAVVAPGTAAQERTEGARLRPGTVFSQPATPTGWIGLSFARPREDGPGALWVMAVAPGSPAERAGIRDGDRVVSWNGQSDVRAALSAANLRPGDEVILVVERRGEADREVSIIAERRPPGMPSGRERAGRHVPGVPRDFEVRVERMRDSLRVHVDSVQRRVRVVLTEADSVLADIDVDEIVARARQRAADAEARVSPAIALAIAGGRGGIGGAQLTDLNDGLGSYFGVDEGALVLRVGPDTPAERAGLHEGDVVVSAGDTAITGVEDLRRVVNRSGSGPLSIVVLRHGERVGLEVRSR